MQGRAGNRALGRRDRMNVGPEKAEESENHLGHKEHNQSNIGREHDGKRSKGKGRILLAGQNHGDGGRDEAQDLGIRAHLRTLSSAGSGGI